MRSWHRLLLCCPLLCGPRAAPLAFLLLLPLLPLLLLPLLLLDGRRRLPPSAGALLLPERLLAAGCVPGPAGLQRAEQAVVVQVLKHANDDFRWEVAGGRRGGAGRSLALRRSRVAVRSEHS